MLFSFLIFVNQSERIMLRTRGSQVPALNLLSRQLEALSLTCGTQSKRGQTRISPRGWRMPKYNSFEEKYWTRARTFPPNWADEHHVFYPSLEDVLKKQEAFENPIRLIDIGQPSPKVSSNLSSEKLISRSERRKKTLQRNLKASASEEQQLLQGLLQTNATKVPFDYDRYLHEWMRSDEGVNETQSLAHHYQIYRDLFPSIEQTHQPSNAVPKVRWDDFYPRPEYIGDEVYDRHFPGAVQSAADVAPLSIYHFRPMVPMQIEFTIPSTMLSSTEPEDEEVSAATLNQLNEANAESPDANELFVSPVYRGNVIRPQYSQLRPSVVIDSSVFASTQKSSTSAEQLLDTVDGQIKVIGNDEAYYTICMLSLDGVNGDDVLTCHWMQANAHARHGPGHEQYAYLPAFGVKGLGYHRYAFVLFRHTEPLSFDRPNVTENLLSERRIDLLNFVRQNAASNLIPVGLKWFQSTYDSVCKRIFHETLDMRMPIYEYSQPKMKLNKQIKFPGPAPFNTYLDHFRDPKEIAKEVLLERLANVRPFDYHRQIQPRTLPPNIYKISHDSPSWLRSNIWKRRNQLGPYRALRPASSLRAHNNNVDLDYPMWPHPSRLEVAMRYPFGPRSPVPLRQTKWSLPPQEHPHLRVQENVDVLQDSNADAKQFDNELQLVKSSRSK